MLFQDTLLDIKIGKRTFFSISQNRLWLFFLAFNFAFLTFDTYIAHFLGHFFDVFISDATNPADTNIALGEYIPVIFSLIFGISVLILAITDIKSKKIKNWIKLLSYLSIIIGLLGFYYHISHNFFFTKVNVVENIIFGPPLLAPLMYIILSLYILAILREDSLTLSFIQKKKRNTFLIYLTAVQVLIVVLLSTFEHSHNYFSSIYEWIPIVIGFFAFSFLLFSPTLLNDKGKFNKGLLPKIYFTIIIVFLMTGICGFGFHIYRNAMQHIPGVSKYFKSFVGSPIFAPLLFANLSIFMILVYFKINSEDKHK